MNSDECDWQLRPTGVFGGCGAVALRPRGFDSHGCILIKRKKKKKEKKRASLNYVMQVIVIRLVENNILDN